MICINTAWAGDLPQIRRSARSWHTKTVQQIQRMDLVMSPLVCEKTNMELITHSQVVRNICDRIPRFPAVKFCYTLLHVMSNAWPDADLALLEATPTRSHVPRTCSWNHIPNPQATHSCITEALVTTSVEEHRLTSVYWFPTGFDLGVKAINKCEVATISCGGEVSHYWAERFKLQWEWLSETGAVYRWGSAHLYKAGASLNANVLMPRVWVCVCVQRQCKSLKRNVDLFFCCAGVKSVKQDWRGLCNCTRASDSLVFHERPAIGHSRCPVVCDRSAQVRALTGLGWQ